VFDGQIAVNPRIEAIHPGDQGVGLEGMPAAGRGDVTQGEAGLQNLPDALRCPEQKGQLGQRKGGVLKTPVALAVLDGSQQIGPGEF
jgi:hypothetical protein